LATQRKNPRWERTGMGADTASEPKAFSMKIGLTLAAILSASHVSARRVFGCDPEP
jgi:hypothetical protein